MNASDADIPATTAPSKGRPPTWLDSTRVHAWLAREVEWPDDVTLQRVTLRRLWPGRHGRITLEWALTLTRGGRDFRVWLQGGVGAEARPKRTERCGRVLDGFLHGISLWNESLDLWCCTPDRDRNLPALRELFDDRRLAELLNESVPARTPETLQPTYRAVEEEGPSNTTSATGGERYEKVDVAPTNKRSDGRNGMGVSSRIVAYRVGKRCVLRVTPDSDAGGGAMYLKILRRPPRPEQLDTLRTLATELSKGSDGLVRTPAILGYLPEQACLITAAVPEPNRLLGTSGDDLSATALATAALHAVPLDTGRVHGPRDELRTLFRWGRAFGLLALPDRSRLRTLAARTAALGRSLFRTRGVGAANELHTPLHRDLYPAQLLRHGDTVYMLDLDTFCNGHGELDLATFWAHLSLDGLKAGESMDAVCTLGQRFVEAYRTYGGRVDAGRLRFYLSCALARLGAIHLVRGVSVGTVEQLWTLADRCLEGEGGLP